MKRNSKTTAYWRTLPRLMNWEIEYRKKEHRRVIKRIEKSFIEFFTDFTGEKIYVPPYPFCLQGRAIGHEEYDDMRIRTSTVILIEKMSDRIPGIEVEFPPELLDEDEVLPKWFPENCVYVVTTETGSKYVIKRHEIYKHMRERISEQMFNYCR